MKHIRLNVILKEKQKKTQQSAKVYLLEKSLSLGERRETISSSFPRWHTYPQVLSSLLIAAFMLLCLYLSCNPSLSPFVHVYTSKQGIYIGFESFLSLLRFFFHGFFTQILFDSYMTLEQNHQLLSSWHYFCHSLDNPWEKKWNKEN